LIEIEDYARYLGLDLEEDKELLYLAKEGLTASLPENWKACTTKNGDIYYFNCLSYTSSWSHPLDK
jgi:centrosomal protein CEP164